MKIFAQTIPVTTVSLFPIQMRFVKTALFLYLYCSEEKMASATCVDSTRQKQICSKYECSWMKIRYDSIQE